MKSEYPILNLTCVHRFIVSLHEVGLVCMREILSSSEALADVHMHGTFAPPSIKRSTVEMIHAGTTRAAHRRRKLTVIRAASTGNYPYRQSINSSQRRAGRPRHTYR